MQNNEMSVFALHLSLKGIERIRQLVGQCPLVRLSGLEQDPLHFETKVLQSRPGILLVEFDPQRIDYASMLERVRRSLPHSPIIALGQHYEMDQMRLAMRMGIREYLAEPLSNEEFNEAVGRLIRELKQASRGLGSLLGVMAAKGGLGASHLALNLAWSLAGINDSRVCLFDGDLAHGDQSTLLDVTPTRTFSHVAANFERLDGYAMTNLLTAVNPNLWLLASPANHLEAEEIEPKHVARALEYLLDDHNYVVADLPNRLDEMSMSVIDRAERFFLISEPSITALRRVQRIAMLSRDLGDLPRKMMVVVNRFDTKNGLARKDIKQIIGDLPIIWLPNDSSALMKATNAGVPVIAEFPRSPWSRKVTKLAQWVVNNPVNQSVERAKTAELPKQASTDGPAVFDLAEAGVGA